MIVDNRSQWSSLKTRNVTVSVRPVPESAYVFRVSRLVQMGPKGREMVFLSPLEIEDGLEGDCDPSMFDGLMNRGLTNKQDHKTTLSMPQKCSNFDLIYTGASMTPVRDVHAALRSMGGKGKGPGGKTHLGDISPDVISPGDFVVFKPSRCNKKARLAQALRLVAQ